MSSAGRLSHVAFFLALLLVTLTAVEQTVWGQSSKKPAAKKTPQLSEELKQFDANGDGKLDANERKAALAAKRSGASAKAKAETQPPAANAPAGAPPAIDPAQDPELAKRFDFNGDGQLDESETQALQSEIERLRAIGSNGGQPPGGPPPGGPPPGGNPPGNRSGFGGGGPGGGGPGGGSDRQARFQEMVKKYDANGDGQLDEAERGIMQANYEKLRGEMMQKYDTNGDGQLDDNERQARDASRLQQYDRNGDGQIDEQERAAMPEYERVRGSRRGGFGGGPGGFGGGPGGFRGNFGGGPLPDFMKQYDTNGDGQLNEQEQAAMQTAMRADFEKRRAEMMTKYDKNKDGQLNEKEQAAMQADYDKLRAEMMKKYDTNGDGQLDDNERTARDASRLKTYDRNKDGKLDESETAAMPEFERMRGGRGGPGGGFSGRGGFGGFGGTGGGYARGNGSPGSSTGASTSSVSRLPGNVKKYDTNNDGKLDDAERKAMQADQQKAKKPSSSTKAPSASSGQAKN